MKLIKFSAPWCGPCRQLAPIIEEIKDLISVHEIDIDEVDPVVLTKYKVKSIPLLIIVDDSENEVWRHIGSISKIDLINQINEYVSV